MSSQNAPKDVMILAQIMNEIKEIDSLANQMKEHEYNTKKMLEAMQKFALDAIFEEETMDFEDFMEDFH